MSHVLLATVAMGAIASCTFAGAFVAGTTATVHNAATDDTRRWSVTKMMDYGAIVGLVLDVAVVSLVLTGHLDQGAF